MLQYILYKKNYWRILYYYFSDKKMYFSFSFFQFDMYFFFYISLKENIYINVFFIVIFSNDDYASYNLSILLLKDILCKRPL